MTLEELATVDKYLLNYAHTHVLTDEQVTLMAGIQRDLRKKAREALYKPEELALVCKARQERMQHYRAMKCHAMQ